MNPTGHNPPIRLVSGGGPIQPEPVEDAPALASSDARWIISVRAASQLEGGQQAMLDPLRRERLIAFGTHLGLRPFDVGLIIAIVQDAARTGRDPFGQTVEHQLRMVRPAERSGRRTSSRAQAISIAALVISIVALSIGLLG